MEEQQRIVAQYGPELSMEVLSDMPVLHACITEALRLFPPLIMLLRLAKTSFSVTDSKGQTFDIPKVGSLPFPCPAGLPVRDGPRRSGLCYSKAVHCRLHRTCVRQKLFESARCYEAHVVVHRSLDRVLPDACANKFARLSPQPPCGHAEPPPFLNFIIPEIGIVPCQDSDLCGSLHGPALCHSRISSVQATAAAASPGAVQAC